MAGWVNRVYLQLKPQVEVCARYTTTREKKYIYKAVLLKNINFIYCRYLSFSAQFVDCIFSFSVVSTNLHIAHRQYSVCQGIVGAGFEI